MKTHQLKKIWLLFKDSAIAWNDDNNGTQGAALSFFTIFSLSPLLLLVIVLSSFGYGQEAASGHLVAQTRGLVGTEGAEFIQSMIANAYSSDTTTAAAIFSVIMVMLGASAVFIQLRDSLNMIWRVKPKPSNSILSFLRIRLLSFGMILGIGFLLLVSLVLSSVLAAMSTYVSNRIAILTGIVSILDLLISFIGITVLFALLFKFLPAVILKWKDVWVGAAVTSLLFSIGKLVIGMYLGNSAVGSTFGAASSLIVIMLWAYYSSQIVLYGAEFTRLYASRFGTAIIPNDHGVRVS